MEWELQQLRKLTDGGPAQRGFKVTVLHVDVELGPLDATGVPAAAAIVIDRVPASPRSQKVHMTPNTAIHAKVPNRWSLPCLPLPLSVMLHWWTGGEGKGPQMNPALA